MLADTELGMYAASDAIRARTGVHWPAQCCDILMELYTRCRAVVSWYKRVSLPCSCNLGGLDIVEGWLEGETEVYRFVTKPDLDKFVPKRLQKHFKEGGLQYTDIIRYDPAKIAQSPFVLDVSSIPPILAERVEPLLPSASIHHALPCQDVRMPGKIWCMRCCATSMLNPITVRISTETYGMTNGAENQSLAVSLRAAC